MPKSEMPCDYGSVYPVIASDMLVYSLRVAWQSRHIFISEQLHFITFDQLSAQFHDLQPLHRIFSICLPSAPDLGYRDPAPLFLLLTMYDTVTSSYPKAPLFRPLRAIGTQPTGQPRVPTLAPTPGLTRSFKIAMLFALKKSTEHDVEMNPPHLWLRSALSGPSHLARPANARYTAWGKAQLLFGESWMDLDLHRPESWNHLNMGDDAKTSQLGDVHIRDILLLSPLHLACIFPPPTVEHHLLSFVQRFSSSHPAVKLLKMLSSHQCSSPETEPNSTTAGAARFSPTKESWNTLTEILWHSRVSASIAYSSSRAEPPTSLFSSRATCRFPHPHTSVDHRKRGIALQYPVLESSRKLTRLTAYTIGLSRHTDQEDCAAQTPSINKQDPATAYSFHCPATPRSAIIPAASGASQHARYRTRSKLLLIRHASRTGSLDLSEHTIEMQMQWPYSGDYHLGSTGIGTLKKLYETHPSLATRISSRRRRPGLGGWIEKPAPQTGYDLLTDDECVILVYATCCMLHMHSALRSQFLICEFYQSCSSQYHHHPIHFQSTQRRSIMPSLHQLNYRLQLRPQQVQDAAAFSAHTFWPTTTANGTPPSLLSSPMGNSVQTRTHRYASIALSYLISGNGCTTPLRGNEMHAIAGQESFFPSTHSSTLTKQTLAMKQPIASIRETSTSSQKQPSLASMSL
ncbi:uncharacterized protein BDR25DRAFT_362555 [Lindgomyces ingoldianus]|uniref:Uncharacterized protein n=1 Tax=Lindgomyces ingoldianus TaxID=673940 RepID=A0ACB6QA35_9PLEO|nr:uncharacterized protein BDR25DRAFT_362555 [Lindgomyces ingoldianus]KAF2463755.1 hypothetical protein BDR25DRAFT_362555 [Lindgomyces ingoldianus]